MTNPPPPYPAAHNLLVGKVAVVTAAAGAGIGQAAARRCLEEGARVVISDAHERRLGETLAALPAEHGDVVEAVPCDVTNEDQVRRLIDTAVARFGRIDLLVVLKVADFAAVRANRRLQERKLGAGSAVMDDAALDRFLAHYQRLTQHMFAEMPTRTDILVEIDRDQRPTRVSTKRKPL